MTAADPLIVRKHLEAKIAELIDMLDLIDCDPDFEDADPAEDNGDMEPSIGWPANGPQCLDPNFLHVGGVDMEQDNADYEDGGDTEPNGDELDSSFSEDGL